MESSMLQRVDEAFPWLPSEIREDCAVIWHVFEGLSAKDLESGLPLFHHDCEYRSAFAPAEGGVAYTGHGGLRKYFNAVFELFDVWRVTPTNFIASDDRIMVLCMFELSGQGSHVTMKAADRHDLDASRRPDKARLRVSERERRRLLDGGPMRS